MPKGDPAGYLPSVKKSRGKKKPGMKGKSNPMSGAVEAMHKSMKKKMKG